LIFQDRFKKSFPSKTWDSNLDGLFDFANKNFRIPKCTDFFPNREEKGTKKPAHHRLLDF